MAKVYRVGRSTRLINRLFLRMTQLGLGAPYRYILTVRGRKTGQIRSTPVDTIDFGGSRWLVAGYGPSNWVENARAAQKVTLSRAGRSETYTVEDVPASDAVPVLRDYMRQIRVTRAYFDAKPDDPDEAIAIELLRHPVLRLRQPDV